MVRIIPQYEVNTRKKLPNWLNKEEIIKAGNATRIPLKKQASKEESKIVISYFCTPCKKVIPVEAKSIIQQQTLSKKANKEFKPNCPNCGNELKVYKETGRKQVVSNLQSINESKVVDVLRKEGTYNTFVDRRIVYETVEKLARYASKLGMTGCVARYIKSEHAKGSSNKISTFDEIECSLEWMYGRKQKGRATASVKIDPAGKFEFPRVFKVASGMEYPFEEKYVRMLEKDAHMFQSLPKRKKSDVPLFRKPDPTRFRVTGSRQLTSNEDKAWDYLYTHSEDDSRFGSIGYLLHSALSDCNNWEECSNLIENFKAEYPRKADELNKLLQEAERFRVTGSMKIKDYKKVNE